ncbi:MAG: hypothetical protein ACLPWF_17985 [Bryobacteraceae bacterium]
MKHGSSVASQKFAQEVRQVGRSPWLLGAVTAAGARVGLYFHLTVGPDQGSGADEGVRPTRDLFTIFWDRTLATEQLSAATKAPSGDHMVPNTQSAMPQDRVERSISDGVPAL